MSIILLISIGIRVIAMGWSIVVGRRLRDWRIGFVTAMLGLMVLRQSLHFVESLTQPGAHAWRIGSFLEFLGLMASILAVLSVICIERMLIEGQATSAELRERETQLFEAQKMEALGKLAGGIAHDFNNILTAILGHLSLVREDLPPSHDSQPDLAIIQSSAERAAGLTQQILAFARRQVTRPKVIDLNETVTDLAVTIRRILGEQIEVLIKPASIPLPVYCDPVQIDQVVMNLVVNAKDAMPKGGRLTVALKKKNGMAELRVSDTGVGNPEVVLQRLFEPFFTTKPVGQGTGLGLSICYGIVEGLGGHLTVKSTVGEGTAFRVRIPFTDQPLEDEPTESAIRRVRGTERILVVEDEPQVRSLLVSTLERHGYRVWTARHGEEALRVLDEESAVDLIVTDVMMPRMGGHELAKSLRKKSETLPILFVSGYAESTSDLSEEDDAMARLPKPFTTHQLLFEVRELLDKR